MLSWFVRRKITGGQTLFYIIFLCQVIKFHRDGLALQMINSLAGSGIL